mgnify:CR=1 FL=1
MPFRFPIEADVVIENRNGILDHEEYDPHSEYITPGHIGEDWLKIENLLTDDDEIKKVEKCFFS